MSKLSDKAPWLPGSKIETVTERVVGGFAHCPFCGSTDIVAEAGRDCDDDYCGAEAGCRMPGCGARVEGADMVTVLSQWNRRTPHGAT